LAVLSSGGTILAAASAAGVSRQAVTKWLKPGHPFADAYNHLKRLLVENTRTRLLILGDQATTTIADAIRAGDTHAALQIVKGMGLLAPPPIGETSHQTTARIRRDRADRVQRQTAEEQRQEDLMAIVAAADGDWQLDDDDDDPDPNPDETATQPGNPENPLPAGTEKGS
jgi:hypothetical protein